MKMKILKAGIATLLVMFAAYVVFAPIGPVPGVMIGGTESSTPETWPDTSGTHEILLEVPGTIPRVVTIWLIQYEGDIYVVGAGDSGWVRMLSQGGPVRMRLGDNTYALRAVAVTDNHVPILTAYADKYRPDYPDIVASFGSIEEANVGAFGLFRLDRT